LDIDRFTKKSDDTEVFASSHRRKIISKFSTAPGCYADSHKKIKDIKRSKN
jgi:predicted transcriptional regulator